MQWIKYFQYYSTVFTNIEMVEFYQLYFKTSVYVIVLHHLELYYVYLFPSYSNH